MPQTALLVIDLQRGAFDGERCPPIERGNELLAHASALIEAARAAPIPVIYVQHCGLAGDALEEGSPHGEFHEAIAPLPADKIVKKHRSNAFDDTELTGTLENLGVECLIFCGLQSEHCVFNTAEAALANGYSVVVAADGHGTWPSSEETADAIAVRINEQLRGKGASAQLTADLVRSLDPTDQSLR